MANKEHTGRIPGRMRIGAGYDIHRLKAGRRLILGGVLIESVLGLDGHSDADVVLHSISDALLGAAALGDIGEHFPDTSPEWKDADSAVMLRQVLDMISEQGYVIQNIDINIIAQEPRLGPAKKNIAANIAALLGLDTSQVSVKARTKEGLGPVGEGRAIEALAAVLIEKTCGSTGAGE